MLKVLNQGLNIPARKFFVHQSVLHGAFVPFISHIYSIIKL